MFKAEACSVPSYIPHMFSNNPNERKHPALHLLFKSLPLRCQFRNFTNVAQAHMRTFPRSIGWFKMVLVRTLLGTFYTWSGHETSSKDAKYLYRMALCDPRTSQSTWIEFFNEHAILIFYAVKEYIIWCIQQQAGLYRVMCRFPNYMAYENEIWTIMNATRDIWRQSSCNFTKISDNLKRFCPKQMKCMRLLLPKTSKNGVDAFRVLVLRQKKCMKYTGRELHVLSDLDELLDLATLGCIEHKTHLEYVTARYGAKNALSIYLEMAEEDQQNVFNWLHLRHVRQNVSTTTLCHRHAELQLKAVIGRHDLKYDPGNLSNVEKSTNYWFCLSCETFRGFIVSKGKPRRVSSSSNGPSSYSGSNGSNCTAYGHDKVAYNIHNNHVYCVTNNPQRKSKKSSTAHTSVVVSTNNNKNNCMDYPCVRINMFARIVRFFNTTLVLCTECVSPFVVSANQSYLKHGGAMHCGACTSLRTYEDTSFCSFCAHRCTVLKEYQMYDDTSKPHKWTTTRLCPRHRRQHWAASKILLKSMLWKMLEGS